MSEIKKLIERLCPNGVEYKKLGDVAKCYSGATPKTGVAAYWENGNIPWMNSGEVNLGRVFQTEKKITQIGFDSCSTKMVPPHTVVIALAGQGKTRGTVAITEIELCTNQSLCAIEVDESLVNSYFLWHYLKGQYQTLRKISSGDGTRGGLNQIMIRNFEIPVPPLEVQTKIVEILDNFTELEAELEAKLEAELEARRKQYEYYRNQLLTFDKVGGARFERLGAMCRIRTGKLNANAQEQDGLYPFFTCDATPFRINTYAFDTEAIIISGNGSQVGHINYYNGRFNAYQRTYVLDSFNKVNLMYILHYLKGTIRQYIFRKSKKGSVPYITLPMLTDFLIPIPPLSEQKRIVSILDRFEALTTDLQSGLPAEIEARRKQYEYYREKLLTFKRI